MIDDPKRLKVAILAERPYAASREQGSGRGAGVAATWLTQFADGLQCSRDCEFLWITLNRVTEESAEARFGPIRWRLVPHVSMTADLLTRFRVAAGKLCRILRPFKPDLIHCWGAEFPYASVIRHMRCPTILSIQGLLGELRARNALPPGWRWRLQSWSERQWIESATVVTCESNWAVERCKHLYSPRDLRLVDYGVHPSFYLARWEPDPNRPVMLYIGGLSPAKGFDVLLDALRLLPGRTWELRVIGNGSMGNEIEHRNLPQVTRCASLTHAEIQHEMSRAWCLVSPTRCDTGPMTVKEARVMGVPVIGSIHGGLRDYIVDGVNGLKVHPLTPQGLAEACDKLMTSFETVQRLGEGRWAEDRAQFRPEATARAFCEIYREMKVAPPRQVAPPR
jgi:glycosyltransferase involved in cell wall biosynthesis